MLHAFLITAGATSAALLLAAGLLHLLPRLGRTGQAFSDFLCRAPGLDVVVTYFTVAPLFVGPIAGGWGGLIGAIVGQVAGLIIWSLLHEAFNPQIRRHPRIISVLNRRVGAARNLTAVYWTAWVVPVFWLIRVAEIIIWPMLIWLVEFPRYRHAEWVNVSRHKFQGLVGHDLIWCLYCDWMTGVWSLGGEMLRNVESFWCPIRFYDGKKCDNCAVDFPDINGGWVAPTATMADVTQKLEEMYPAAQTPNAWFGHPVRLTVNGKPPS
ncbi:MAG TPA: hypothetical protein PLD59_14800 [Tepidisphaeraceae bacterium]|mgnify:CR=1 FL=1|nr:hypothetical protein [Tepidisphaeraceae bacterium]